MQIECEYFIFKAEMKLFCNCHSVWNELICQETVKRYISLSVYMCTCCAARSSCKGCESDRPIVRDETACELAPSSHIHPGANESNCAPSLSLHQADQYRQRHLSCRKEKQFRLLLLGSCCCWDTGEHLYTSTLLSVPVPLAIGFCPKS